MMELNAIQETIEVKSKLEAKKYKYLKKKEEEEKDLTKLNQGKSSIKTIFLSKDGKVNKITNLTHSITAVN